MLKPCPFCGGDAFHDHVDPTVVCCLECNTEVRSENPVSVWNNRNIKKQGLFKRFIIKPIKFFLKTVFLMFFFYLFVNFGDRVYDGNYVVTDHKTDSKGNNIYGVTDGSNDGFYFVTTKTYEIGQKLSVK